MIQWILVNINTAPDTGVIRPDRDNSKTRLNTSEMFFPEVIGGWFTYDNSFTCLFSVPARPLNFVCSIGDI